MIAPVHSRHPSPPHGGHGRARPVPGHSFGRLYGREGDLAALAALLEDPCVRLVTLTGPAGVGKSHLAHAALDAAPRSVESLVVDLADAVDESALWVGLGACGEAEAAERIGADGLLLVLDNCDPVVAGGALALSALLRACPRLKVLVTSRVSLDIRAERIHPVEPLATGLEAPAVALLTDLVRSRFRGALAGGHDLRTARDICVELDGIPLAIEMAAEAVGTRSPKAVLARLRAGEYGDRRRLRDIPARHRSVAAAMSWAEQALTDGDRELLGNLAVFETGVDIEAVRIAGGLDREQALAATDLLIRRSLLLTTDGGDAEPSFRLPHMARVHYRTQLARSPEAEQRARDRHARHHLVLARTIGSALRAGGPRGRLLAVVEDRLPDLRCAVAQLRSRGDYTAVLRLLTALEEPLLGHGLALESAKVIEECAAVSATAGTEPVLVAEALMAVARWALDRGDTQRAATALDRARCVTAELPGVRARVTALTGELRLRCGELPEAAALLDAALEELDAAGDLRAAALARRSQALVRRALGDADAEQPVLRALDDLRTLPVGAAAGGVPESPAPVRARLLIALARVRHTLGRAPEAHESAREAMRQLLDAGGPAEVAEALEVVAAVASVADGHQRYRVARVLAHAESIRRRHGLQPAEGAAVRHLHEDLRPDVDPGVLRRLRAGAHRAPLREALVAGLFTSAPNAPSAPAQPPGTPAPEGGAAPGADAERPPYGLTARQHQVALLVADGLTNSQVARELEISEWTVVNHLRGVMQKMDCPSRVHIVRALHGSHRDRG